jgi:hypothetical protein
MSDRRTINRWYFRCVWFCFMGSELLFLQLYYPRVPFWLLFLAGVGCGALAMLTAEIVKRLRDRRAGRPASGLWDWRSPY